MSSLFSVLFDKPANLDTSYKAFEKLGSLARWWMTDSARSMAVEKCPELEHYNSKPNPGFERANGFCHLLIVNHATNGMLQPSFFLPVRWRNEKNTPPRLPNGILKTAEEVVSAFSSFGGDSFSDWSPELGVEDSDLSSLEIPETWVPSAWAGLAIGLISAEYSPAIAEAQYVFATGAWKTETGMCTIDGLAEKIRLLTRYRDQTEGDFLLFLPESNRNHAREEANNSFPELGIVGLKEDESNAILAFQHFFRLRKIPNQLLPELVLKSDFKVQKTVVWIKELDRFEEEDQETFLGRKRDIDALIERIENHPIVVLQGESGVGKSSLLRAGLIPRLRDNYHVAILCPGSSPSTSIPESCTDQLLETGSFSMPLDYDRLLIELLDVTSKSDSKKVVLVLDQFEDIANNFGSSFEFHSIKKFLCRAALQQADQQWLHVVCAMRWNASAEISILWDDIQQNYPKSIFKRNLQNLSVEDAEIIIETTAIALLWQQTEGFSARDAAEQLASLNIDSAPSRKRKGAHSRKDKLVYPPYLQLFLFNCEKKCEPPCLSAAILGDSGRKLFEDYLDSALKEIKGAGAMVLRRLTRSDGTRTSMDIDQLASAMNFKNETLKQICDDLETYRLIRKSAGGHYEIIHEKLAQIVCDRIPEGDKERKLSEDLLVAKVELYGRIRELHSLPALVEMYRHFDSIRLNETQLRHLLASSTAHQLEFRRWDPELEPTPVFYIGWYWYRNVSRSDFSNFLEQQSENPNPNVAAAAIQWLGKLGSHDHINEFFKKWYLRPQDRDENQIRSWKHPMVRRAAMSVLLDKRKQDKAILLEAAEDPDAIVRQYAIRRLGKLSRDDGVEALKKIANRDGKDQATAFETLTHLIDASDADWLREWIGADDEAKRIFAINQLGILKDQTSLEPIRALFKSNDRNILVAAINAVSQFNEWQDLPALVDLCKSTSSNSVRSAAELAIASLQISGEIARLIPFGLDDSPVVRRAIIANLERNGSEESRAFIVQTLKNDTVSWVRIAAAQRLPLFQNKSDVKLLFEILESVSPNFNEDNPRSDRSLASAVEIAIGKYRDRVEQSELVSVKKTARQAGNIASASAATKLLKPSSGKESFDLVKEALDSGFEELRYSAVRALYEDQTPPSLELLEQLTSDEDERIKSLAFLALANQRDFPLEELAGFLYSSNVEVATLAADKINSCGDENRLQLLMDFVVERLVTSVQVDTDEALLFLPELSADSAVRTALSILESWEDKNAIEILKACFDSRSCPIHLQLAVVKALIGMLVRSDFENWFKANADRIPPALLRWVDQELYAPDWGRQSSKRVI